MSASKYVLNFDELSDNIIPMIKEIEEEIKRSPPEMSMLMKQKLMQINEKIPSRINTDDICDNLKNLLNLISQIQEVEGDFCIDGEYKNIPAVSADHEIIFKYNGGIYLSALEFSQSGWKKQDKWSLKINNQIVFDNICTKEIGDKKYFFTLRYIPPNTEIKFILHNISGNSRQTWVDLEYIIPNTN